MIEKAPILITGIPRSGASTVAKIINACGAFGGSMTHPLGRYENERIRETVVKSFLSLSGIDVEGQYPLVPVQSWIPTTFKKDVEKIIIEQGYKKDHWMYKDSRMALMFEVWNYAFPDAKWIIVRRRSGDIIESCLQTGFMSAFKKEQNRIDLQVSTENEGWLHMIHHYENQFVKMINEGLNCRMIWPERMKQGDYRQLYDTLDWLGLPWKNEAINIMNTLLRKED